MCFEVRGAVGVTHRLQLFLAALQAGRDGADLLFARQQGLARKPCAADLGNPYHRVLCLLPSQKPFHADGDCSNHVQDLRSMAAELQNDTVMPESLFEELKRYVGFGVTDEQALRTLHPVARPHFDRISEVFYQRILEHEAARKALVEGESMVGRLRHTLVAWMDKLLTGPWDQEYYELRARIGRKHVDIALPQHYMFGAMNVLRQELNALIDISFIADAGQLRNVRLAVGKILDLELAIMLHTYREDLLSQQARSERLSTFGQLVGSIGHELRNPLGVIESSLYILRGRVGAGDERATKHVDRITEQLGIANTIITDLLDMICAASTTNGTPQSRRLPCSCTSPSAWSRSRIFPRFAATRPSSARSSSTCSRTRSRQPGPLQPLQSTHRPVQPKLPSGSRTTDPVSIPRCARGSSSRW